MGSGQLLIRILVLFTDLGFSSLDSSYVKRFRIIHTISTILMYYYYHYYLLDSLLASKIFSFFDVVRENLAKKTGFELFVIPPKIPPLLTTILTVGRKPNRAGMYLCENATYASMYS